MANPYYKSTEEYLEKWSNRNTGSSKSVEEYRTNYQNALLAAVQKGEEKRQQNQVQTPVLDASKAAAAERAKRREEKRQAAGVALPSSTVIPGKNNAVMTPGGKNSVLDTVGTFQNIKNEQTGTSGTSGMPSHAPFVSEDAKRENLTTNYQLREPTGAPIAENVQRGMASNMAWLTLSDEERAKRIAEYNDEQIIQQAEAVNKQYDEKMAAFNQANAAYEEWLKKNQSDEVINAMAADYDAPEWVAFRAEGERLYAEAKKYDDEADALRLQADALHDQALYIQDMRRINELLPKMDEETRKAFDIYADTQVATKDFYQRMAQLGVQEGEARRLAETWKRNKNKEGMENFSGAVKDVTREQGYVGGNLASIAANAIAPFTGFLAASFAGLSGGRYRSADPNGFLFAPTVMADSAREATAEDIRGENGNIIRAGVADIYNGAMGAADNVLRTMVYGKNATAIMAMDVYQRTVRNASVSGASKEQALALGLASAGLEYLTERVGVDNMLDALEGAKKDAARKGFMAFLKQTGKNYVEELPQEVISFWGNAAAEAVILRNDSDFNKSVQNYMAQGMDEKNAKAAAWKDLLWDGSLRVAWDTGWSTLFQTGFSTAVGKMMSNIEQDTAEGAPPDGTPPVAPAKEAVEAAQQAQAEEATQTPTAEQTVQQVMQGLPGQTAQQTVQQQAQETPTAAVDVQPPQTQMETQTAEQEQAAPQQMTPADEAALKLARLTETKDYPGVDTVAKENYNGITKMQGGNENGTGLQQNDGAGSIGNPAQGMAGVREADGTESQRRNEHGGVVVDSGVVRLSDDLQKAQAKKGTPVYDMHDTTEKPGTYALALENGRNSDAQNGWCVTPKSEGELKDESVRTFMNADGTVGVGVKPDGDIVAVFKNKNGGPKRAMDTAMPIAIEQGGDRLDCYGKGLVGVYARYGFVPVARVEFNPEYANPGWTADKGTPYIYFMMHNGDSAATVVDKMGTYPEITKAQLDALPTFGKDDYDAAMDYRDKLIDQKKQEGGYGQNTVGGAQSQFDHEVKTSAQYSNTYAKTNDAELQQLSETAKEKDPTIYQYDATTEKESLHNAELRTATEEDRAAEYDALMEKDGWTAEDNDTAYAIEKQLMRDGKADEATKLERRRREEVTKSAQLVQSMAKYSRNADEAYSNGAMALGELTKDNVPKRFWKKQGFDTWKAELTKSFSEMVERISAISEGDTEAMKDVIRSLARFRNTTAWFGMSKGLTKAAEAGLRNLDYDMAKTVALTQVTNIPGDFVKRSVGEVVKTMRFQSMLASLKSPVRNVVGNSAMVIDAVSDSTVGRFFDHLVSYATGKREVGNDIGRSKEFVEGGKKAAEFGSLCVELAIPMESDDKYMEQQRKKSGTAHSRTFSPRGNALARFLSAVEKYYSYAYGVSDLFFEGGHASAVDASLEKLGDSSGLTAEERKAVAQQVGQRRTFKQDGTLAEATKKAKQAANKLTDKISPNMGLGDILLPFSRVNANMAQVAADYTGLGVKGAVEIFSLIRDAMKGKDIAPGRQRKAVTDAARGVTGAGLVAMMTAFALSGVLKGADDDDWDRAAYEESTGQIGAQFNISAAIRGLTGKSTEWQKDDVVMSLDFLEPYNAQMLLGTVLAEDIKNGEGIKNYPMHAFNSVLEAVLNNPSMELVNELSDLVQDLGKAETAEDYAGIGGEFVGEIASGFIPNFVRQIAKTIDPVKRDTTAKTSLETAVNKILTGIPFASEALPAKYGADGEPIARNEPGWLTAVNNFLNPATVSQLKDPAIADYLGALSDRTGNVSIYPESKAPRSFKVDGKEVEVYGKEDRETYHRTYMENIETVYGGLINDGEFAELSDGRQLAVLGYAKEYATAMAKKALYPDYEMPAWMDGMEDDPVNTVLLHEYKSSQNDQGNSFSENKHGEMVGAGIPDGKAKDVQSAVAGLKPEAGKTNVRTIQQLEAIMDVGGLSENQRVAAMHAYLDGDQDAKMDKLMGVGYGLTVDQFVDTYRAYLDRENAEDGKKDIAAALGKRASDPLVEKVWKAYQGK